ncbi:MAG: GAF domain-containing protein [Candidatus Eisenbacteria bacterium]
MSGLSSPDTPALLAWLESRCLRGTLARKLAVVLCTVLAVSTAGVVELDWHVKRAEDIRDLTRRAAADSRRLAARLHGSDLSAPVMSAILLPYAAGSSTLERMDLVDASGRTVWTSRAESLERPFDPRRLGWSGHFPDTWLGRALGAGGTAAASRRGDRVSAIEPIHPGWPEHHGHRLKPGAPVALIAIWDERQGANAADTRRLYYHGIGLLCALALGWLLWWLMRRVVSRPLAELAAVAGRPDLVPSDLELAIRRDDEIGALARALSHAVHRLEERRTQVELRTARLESALNAGKDGLAMASLHDGTWRIDHANEVMAALVGKPANWLEHKTVHEGLAAMQPRTIDFSEVATWVGRGLADPQFEGSMLSVLIDPDAIIEASSRPMRDGRGAVIGRIWILRDVTSERAHERTLTRQNQELAVIDLVGRRVSRTLDAREILGAACETLSEILEAHGEVSPAGVAGGSQDDVVRLDPTCVVVPLSDSIAPVAMLQLRRPAGVPFGEDEMALLRRIRHPVESALENARLFARTEEQLVENQTLCEVSRSIGRADALDDVLSDILRVVCARLAFRIAAILLPDEATGELYVRASEGYHENLDAIRMPIDGASVTARCFRAGAPVNVPDVTTDEGYVPGSFDIRSELALPLKIGERVLGILDIESERPDAFGPEDERLLASVASQAAIVLWNASLFAEVRARATRFEAVNEIARAVSSTLDPTRLDRAIVSQLARVVPCDRYAVLRYDHERRRVERALVFDTWSKLVHDGDGLDWAFEEGLDPARLVAHRAESFANLPAAPKVAEVLLVAHGMTSMVLIPVALDGEIQAAIVACSKQANAFSTEQIRLLEAVSYHVGVALKNAALFSRLQVSYMQLNEAQDGLVRSEKLRALGEMASGVAHDFNNVLGAIVGRAQLLRGTTCDAETASELAIIERAALDGAATVRRLQDFTRVRTDRVFQPVALSQVVEDCLSLTRGRWRDEAERAGRQYDVTTELSPIPHVAGQASELREVFTNLILNALDAMPNGGALGLATRYEADAAGGLGEVVVEVADAGRGMSADVRARIFDPFFTTKGVGGVGLGLSVVYGIVQRHGGRIEVESAPDAGTRMRVRLPGLAQDAGAGSTRDPLTPNAPPIRPCAAATAPLRVLVIDDEPNVRTLLADLLRAAGHTVLEASSGRDAVEIMERDAGWDLVMTDLGMPDLSGWDVARAVAGLPDPPPVILVTGWGIQLDDRMLAESSVAAVVAKPFTIEEILDAVERVVPRAA